MFGGWTERQESYLCVALPSRMLLVPLAAAANSRFEIRVMVSADLTYRTTLTTKTSPTHDIRDKAQNKHGAVRSATGCPSQSIGREGCREVQGRPTPSGPRHFSDLTDAA